MMLLCESTLNSRDTDSVLRLSARRAALHNDASGMRVPCERLFHRHIARARADETCDRAHREPSQNAGAEDRRL